MEERLLLMSQRYMLVVQLWVHPGREAEFDAFESRAAELMATHGGRVEQAIRMVNGQGADAPYEVHVVSFPSGAAYDAFAADGAVTRLRGLRAQIISRTEVLAGVEAGPYPAGA
jgi:hypothetical protein